MLPKIRPSVHHQNLNQAGQLGGEEAQPKWCCGRHTHRAAAGVVEGSASGRGVGRWPADAKAPGVHEHHHRLGPSPAGCQEHAQTIQRGGGEDHPRTTRRAMLWLGRRTGAEADDRLQPLILRTGDRAGAAARGGGHLCQPGGREAA